MKIYFVSTYGEVLKNTGLIRGSYWTYDAAFEAAKVGEFIHAVEVHDVYEVRNAGKMAVRMDGGTE